MEEGIFQEPQPPSSAMRVLIYSILTVKFVNLGMEEDVGVFLHHHFAPKVKYNTTTTDLAFRVLGLII